MKSDFHREIVTKLPLYIVGAVAVLSVLIFTPQKAEAGFSCLTEQPAVGYVTVYGRATFNGQPISTDSSVFVGTGDCNPKPTQILISDGGYFNVTLPFVSAETTAVLFVPQFSDQKSYNYRIDELRFTITDSMIQSSARVMQDFNFTGTRTLVPPTPTPTPTPPIIGSTSVPTPTPLVSSVPVQPSVTPSSTPRNALLTPKPSTTPVSAGISPKKVTSMHDAVASSSPLSRPASVSASNARANETTLARAWGWIVSLLRRVF